MALVRLYRLSWLITLAACSNADAIQVRPAAVDFGTASPGERRLGTFLVENHDDYALDVEVVVTEGRSWFVLEQEAGLAVEAGRALSIPLVAEAADIGAFSGVVEVRWNGGEREVALSLTTSLSGIDGDRDGVPAGTDCDDADPAVSPGQIEVCDGRDEDCSGVVDDATDADGDGVGACTDCDDTDPLVAPGAEERCDGLDGDCDGAFEPDEVDGDGDNHLPCADFVDLGLGLFGGDCDDADGGRFPGAGERCNGLDDDCDGAVASVEDDEDGDLWLACLGFQGDEPLLGGADCDDLDPQVWPGAPELCDAMDQDCDGTAEDASIDGDGDGLSACDGDCDDTEAVVFPGAPELCDGLDGDCDGVLPADEADLDLDLVSLCGGDCDDADPTRAPGLPESCDGFDSDCDGVVPPTELDGDGDLAAPCAGDCDDGDATVSPLAAEICDGLDDDCDGSIPADENDADLDGYTICGGDCADLDAAVHPGQAELCDGIDGDCSGNPYVEADSDGDGVRVCGADCNDQNPGLYPGNVETCDNLDQDCDLIVDEGLDLDLDGLTPCAGDCDDTEALVFAGAPEICDGADSDCDGAPGPDEVDADGDGASLCAGDCDDNDPAIGGTGAEVCNGLDDDCDTFVDEDVDLDLDGVEGCAADCDDTNAARAPGQPEGCDGIDNNCDLAVPAGELDGDGDGFAPCEGDCADASASSFPGAPEICDGLDTDCDLLVDDGFDLDGDGAFDTTDAGCAATWGPAADCDDGNADIHPGAVELCNGVDDDCDTVVPVVEADGDTDGERGCEGDCDDTLNVVWSGATETCDSLDNDCDLSVDEDFDGDADGFVDGNVLACWLSWGLLSDCDDTLATTYPGAVELCDGEDGDCDGLLPLTEADGDGDGEMACDGDCDDTDDTVASFASEGCDTVDNDCDLLIDEDFDADSDGWVDGADTDCAAAWDPDQLDCDDASAAVFPGATELCNGDDDDCNGAVPTNEVDGDGDGEPACEGDCVDSDPDIASILPEVACNNIDDDCDGVTDPGDQYSEFFVKSTSGSSFQSFGSDLSGGFAAPVTYDPPGVGIVWAAIAGDFDGDNDLDMIAERAEAWPTTMAVHLYRSNCQGAFTESSIGGTGGVVLSGLAADLQAAADLDLDGDLDLVGWDWDDGQGWTWLNGGNGSSWTRIPALSTSTTRPFSLTYWSPFSVTGREVVSTPLVDVTADGYPDLVECSNGAASPTTCRVHVGLGDGNFTLSPTTWSLTRVANGIALADFDGDGATDLIAGLDDDGDAGQAWIWRGTPGQPLAPTGGGADALDVVSGNGPNSDAAGYGWLAPYDFDWDGDEDLIVSVQSPFGGTTHALHFAENDGTGAFSTASFATTSHQWSASYPFSPEMISVPVFP